jgi:type I restriction enzyme S subunit
MKAYPQYKDSGIVWLGRVPEHWDLRPLRTVLKQRNEKNSPIKTNQILSLSIAKGVTLYSHEGRGGNKRKDDLSAYKIAHIGDIILNSMNVVVGAVGLSKYFGAISPVYYALYPATENTNILYYEKIFSNAVFQRFLLIYGKGILIKKSDSGKLNTIRMKISSNDLKSSVLPIPPIDEQLQIARYLDWQTSKINKFIKAKKKLIELLKEQKQYIINQAVTKGIDPNVKMKDSDVEWLREIPEHWEVTRMANFGRFYKGKGISRDNLVEKGIPCLLYGDIYTKYSIKTNHLFSRIPNADKTTSFYIKKNDLLLAGTGETFEDIGKCIHYTGNEEAYAGGDVIIFRQETYDSLYLSYLINSSSFREQKAKIARGGIIVHMYSTKLRNIHFYLPSLKEQKLILNFIECECSRIKESIIKIQKQIKLIQEYLICLISDVVTGKIDVRNIEIPDFEFAEAEMEVLDDKNIEDEFIAEDVE